MQAVDQEVLKTLEIHYFRWTMLLQSTETDGEDKPIQEF
jgi:hypothetical protein